ncbi:hypothetical protein Tco_0418247 [Tanacetum coccineum]
MLNNLTAFSSREFKFLTEIPLQDLEFKERMQKYTRFDAQSFQDAMICNMDSIRKYMKTQQLQDENRGQGVMIQIVMMIDISIYDKEPMTESFAVTTADASDKCQQQPDSTSSTSTLATTVTADGNFDL